ncbi:cysteine hydrolase family protein [Rhodococcus sp. ACT016]|uniref:cysteine hydrolase family protein n=1 Tax=Rhodococcus sp. ACT016 TaxID=3134808 RepID=UPI003D2A170C
MPITTVDPKTALIVVDMQKGVVGMPTVHSVDTVIQRIGVLLQVFRARGLPVALVNVAGTPPGRTDTGVVDASRLPADWTELIEQVDPQPGDIRVTKRARSGFTGTGLADRLHSLEVTQVVVVGLATSVGVETTALDAYERGFHVTLPVDAMTDRTLERHNHSVTTVFPGIAQTGTTADVLAVL